MKSLLVLMSLFLISTAFAESTTVSSNYKVRAQTEQEAMILAQESIPLIKELRIKEVIRKARRNNCTIRPRSTKNKHNIKVTGVDIDKMYKLDNGTLIPYYRASIRYYLKRCRSSRH